jgi:hypothetical protein
MDYQTLKKSNQLPIMHQVQVLIPEAIKEDVDNNFVLNLQDNNKQNNFEYDS